MAAKASVRSSPRPLAATSSTIRYADHSATMLKPHLAGSSSTHSAIRCAVSSAPHLVNWPSSKWPQPPDWSKCPTNNATRSTARRVEWASSSASRPLKALERSYWASAAAPPATSDSALCKHSVFSFQIPMMPSSPRNGPRSNPSPDSSSLNSRPFISPATSTTTARRTRCGRRLRATKRPAGRRN